MISITQLAICIIVFMSPDTDAAAICWSSSSGTRRTMAVSVEFAVSAASPNRDDAESPSEPSVPEPISTAVVLSRNSLTSGKTSEAQKR